MQNAVGAQGRQELLADWERRVPPGGVHRAHGCDRDRNRGHEEAHRPPSGGDAAREGVVLHLNRRERELLPQVQTETSKGND